MTWSLSRFRTGDLVQVRSKEEILATLDQRGCIDGMPFMPEMLQYCGKRFRVSAVAHKTCDTVRRTGKRRLHSTVHLGGLRCDGSAHGGCQAECLLFWKDVWLQPVADDRKRPVRSASRAPQKPSSGCTESVLLANVRLPSRVEGEEQAYCCQATRLYEATEPLAPFDVREHFFDVITGNRSAIQVLRVLWLGLLRWLLPRVPFGYQLLRSFSDWMHQTLAGRTTPSLHGKIDRGRPTPTGRIDLKPGEFARIKPQDEIEKTLNGDGKNRGLGYDAEEMSPYCGGVYRVRRSVTQIIDEQSGKMLYMKQPCLTLEGVVCTGEYAARKLNCPRAMPAYWRELWLERAAPPGGAVGRSDSEELPGSQRLKPS
jgi:hypothetical protein